MYILIMNKEGHMFAGDRLTTDIDKATKFTTEFEAIRAITPMQWAYPDWEVKKI